MKSKAGRKWLHFLLIFFWTIPVGCTGQAPKNTSPQKPTPAVSIPFHPLSSEKDLNLLMQKIGSARVVMLGEASHGTHEYYAWRAAITKRLIQEKGFDFIAVEGEWADSYRINNFIKGPRRDSAAVLALLQQFNRWPTWMWGNYEIASLVRWLNNYNQGKDSMTKAGFYGLDVYCLWESMAELMPFLEGRDPSIIQAAKKVHTCFQPYGADPERYALAVQSSFDDCGVETSRLWKAISRSPNGNQKKSEAQFVMEQNALVALNGERYYRAMVSSGAESWNIRDRHMMQTLKRLLEHHGSDSKAIVWAHNTHVGDARHTDMVLGGEVNLGQLARQELGQDKVYVVGFGSHSGSVIAATSWGVPYGVMNLPAAQKDSWEHMLHAMGDGNKMVLSAEIRGIPRLQQAIGHRAVGVVYRSQLESRGNYVPSVIPKRYDAFLFIDKTNALHPIRIPLKNEPPDLYPSGT
jgi:erythromycin esterase-like protein